MNGIMQRTNVRQYPGANHFHGGGMSGLSGLSDYWDVDDHGNYVWVTSPLNQSQSGGGAVTTGGTVAVTLPSNTSSGWAQFANTLAQQVGGYLNQRQALDNAKFALQARGVIPNTGDGGGQGLTGLVAQITTFASNNPLLVAAGVAGVFLLMMNPPSKRR